GISQIKEKWTRRRRLGRLISLFVSASGDYIAVACGNQVSILQKDNDYQGSVGTFTCESVHQFTCGTWSESHALLGVVDDTDIIYVIKPNGEEMTRILKKHLSVSSSASIIGLVVQDDASERNSYLCTFTVVVSDGSFCDIEISKDPSSVLSKRTLSYLSIPVEFPQRIVCWDYHPQLCLFVFISSSGDNQSAVIGKNSVVSIWRKGETQMEVVTFAKFEGSFNPKKGSYPLSSGKVLFSPSGNSVASLDSEGCLFYFQFDEEKRSLSKACSGNIYTTKFDTSKIEMMDLHNIVDFTWWTDDVLVLAKRNGTISMIDFLNGEVVSNEDLACSMPLLERVYQFPGHIFILENTVSDDRCRSLEQMDLNDLTTLKTSNQFDISNMQWSLLSVFERSPLEIYNSLIASHQYEAALEFAEHHGLDKEDVWKSQWVSSDKGVHHVVNVLPKIKDIEFILSECVSSVGPTEEAMRSLLSFGLQLTNSYIFSEPDDENGQIWNYRITRLKLLQFGDMLETFLGINMGSYQILSIGLIFFSKLFFGLSAFSSEEYRKFRDLPVGKSAIALAECGKIGALNLLFKCHPCSLSPSILEVLAAIPETIPVQKYGQLLPAVSPHSVVVLRDEDWVESEKMVIFLRRNHGSSPALMTESMMIKYMPFLWPSISELSSWYRKRAIDIDSLSGQLDNCMSLVDIAIHKGISELQMFLEDVSCLHEIIYSVENEDAVNLSMDLATWDRLSDYDKFKFILMGVKEDKIIARLHNIAVPFMQQKFLASNHSEKMSADSFLVRWLKEAATQNNLDICLIVIEEGCREAANSIFFKDELELVECSLDCVYMSAGIDQWSIMQNIISKLSEVQYNEAESIKQRLKVAEGHVEAGRLLAYYQVPKPINFLLDAHIDEKGVKQIFRLIISKFIRWQPSRTDHDWANMWRDIQSLQEKAFLFVDLEYLLIEFCRGLLKAGKFSFARNYLKGNSSVALATEKAESLVIQAAREYFFSAPTLASPEIWKAKECLSIFANNRNVRVEADIIDALTVRLPNLGVNLLPMAFRQIKDRMEIIKLAITSQSGTYMNVDELIEIARLLGLSSQEEISAVQEAIAREAAFAGDMQLAFDLCLVLAKRGHGSIWDLCTALARSKALEDVNSKSLKFLLGFALGHCDDESIVELLQEWKDLDLQDNSDSLISFTGEESVEFSEISVSIPLEFSGRNQATDSKQLYSKASHFISLVARESSCKTEYDWNSLEKNEKVINFTCSKLPWLIKLGESDEFGKGLTFDSTTSVYHVSIRARALMTILSWLARNYFIPRDDLIASLAKSVMEFHFSDEEDILGCSILLNLVDPIHGAEIIENQLQARENDTEFSHLMTVGLIYSFLHSSSSDCKSPAQKRELLLNIFQKKPKTLSSEECMIAHDSQSLFWNEWKVKLEQQKITADRSRELQKLIPVVEASRFLSGDTDYIQSVIFSLIDSVKFEKKKILNDALMLAGRYGLDHRKASFLSIHRVLLHYLKTILVSEMWTVDDIAGEVSGFKENILGWAGEVIQCLSSVYEIIDGRDKERLAFIYGMLSECYMHLETLGESPDSDTHLVQKSTVGVAPFCELVGLECGKVSFIKSLNFKNIAGLTDLNFTSLKDEVLSQIDENNVDALATMVQNLSRLYGDAAPEGLLSSKDLYLYHVSRSLAALEGNAVGDGQLFQRIEDAYCLVDEIELVYGIYEKYMGVIGDRESLDVGRRFFRIVLLVDKSLRDVVASESVEKDCSMRFIGIWLRLMNHMEGLILARNLSERFYPEFLIASLKAFSDLLSDDIISPNQCWHTLVDYVVHGLKSNGASEERLYFFRAMVSGGCSFRAVGIVFNETLRPPESLSISSNLSESADDAEEDLPKLYLKMMENILQGVEEGGESLGNKRLHLLVSSLSKLEEDIEVLKRVRLVIWGRLSSFSNDVRLSSQLRVCALELMQFISGRKMNSEIFRANGGGEAYDLAWEGWDHFLQEGKTNNEDSCDEFSAEDVSSRFVALKSSQLIADAVSPGLEITPDDLLSVDSAVSCFRKLIHSVDSDSHVRVLIDVLAEWEPMFIIDEKKNAGHDPPPAEASENWSNDDWDEGWEKSFRDEESVENETVEKRDSAAPPPLHHPLHVCWTMIVEKLLVFSDSGEFVLELLDRNSGRNPSYVILDEDEAASLLRTAAAELDCFLAFEMALLLPYRAMQLQYLDDVEKRLETTEGVTTETVSRDGRQRFLVLVLSSGILSTVIIPGASHGRTLSYLTFLVGNSLRRFQETMQGAAATEEDDGRRYDSSSFFIATLFPSFVCELVRGDQQILAGFLVTRFVHTNPSLSLMSTGDANLRKYL
ncbi:hypothetical protein M569_06101, partial [Genlisea aurea]